MSKKRRDTFAGKQAYPVRSWPCPCEADQTWETAMLEARRGNPPSRKRAKMVFHVRRRDRARFWHWSDSAV